MSMKLDSYERDFRAQLCLITEAGHSAKFSFLYISAKRWCPSKRLIQTRGTFGLPTMTPLQCPDKRIHPSARNEQS